MREYEVMTIHRPDLAEEEIEAKVGELESFLSNQGASIANRDLWGKRRLAYEIDHMSEGYYSVITFEAEAPAIAPVHRMLSLSDDIVRHKIHRLGD